VNKFIAMLRDSYKEAVDGWIFPVMFVLSTIVILLVACISYSPLPLDAGLEKVLRSDQLRFVNQDRGNSTRVGQFFYQAKSSEVKIIKEGDKPWDSEFSFTFEAASSFPGMTGVEMDNTKEPTNVKQIQSNDLDAFRAAVRYWASKPGEPKPEYSDELAKEFVMQLMTDVLQLKEVTVEKQKPKGIINGFFPGNKFTINAKGLKNKAAWVHTPGLFFGLVPIELLETTLGKQVYNVESRLVNGLGAWILLLTGVIVTAAFIPNMIRKGSIDLLISKPISRSMILIYKYLGGMFFVFLLTAYTIIGLWVAVGLSSGTWGVGILTAIFGITFYFSILYAFETLIGVLTRNVIVSIVATIVFWAVLFVLGFAYNTVKAINSIDFRQMQQAAAQSKEKTKEQKKDVEKEKPVEVEITRSEKDKPIPDPFEPILKLANRLTPRTNDVDDMTSLAIAADTLAPAEIRQMKKDQYSWAEIISISSFYIILFILLALLRFNTRSY
jgi:ABC-type transport system involved in multi-copper enzyme maturation permease subunit